MALQLQGIIGEGEESVEGNSQTEGEIERLRTLQESYDALSRSEIGTELSVGKQQLAAAITEQGVPTAEDAPLDTMATNVAAIVAHYPNTNDESVELTFSGDTPTTLMELLYAWNNITSIRKKTAGNDGSLGSLTGTQATKVIWEEDTDLTSVYLYNTTMQFYIREARMPKGVTANSARMFYACQQLRILYMPKMLTFHLENISGGLTRLIDVTVGESFSAGQTITWLRNWNPTEALLTSSTSLVEDGEIFSSNREKLLYNIREHFAALLPTVTTTSKIQLNSTLKAAIDADNATASAFSNKGWTLYS